MNRRNFLSLFSAGVAGIALEQAIPLGRVWSFPKEIVIPELPFSMWNLPDDFEAGFSKHFAIGSTIQVRFPQHFVVMHEPPVTYYTKSDIRKLKLEYAAYYCGLPPG